MEKKILVAVDDSENAMRAVEFVISQQSSFCLLEEKKKELSNTALQNAKSKLVDAGFAEKNITIKSEIKKRGIARDIIKESQAGYSVIVLGRRGLSGIKDFVLGSISHKVFNGAKDASVLVVN